MPEETPAKYSENKDLVIILANEKFQNYYKLITTYPESRTKRHHD